MTCANGILRADTPPTLVADATRGNGSIRQHVQWPPDATSDAFDKNECLTPQNAGALTLVS
jgi:hypothetical protein